MVRQAICDPKFEKYLAGLGQTHRLSIGLVIGQISPNGKDLIVHLARTPLSDKKSEGAQELVNVSDIENSQVAEHALNAQRMIVGGFNILGLFVVSEKNITGGNGALQKLKTVLMDIKSTLESNGLLYANTDDLDKGDKLLLNYVSGHKNFISKTISTDPSKAAAANPVDWKFVKGTDWQEFETYFEIDTFFPLPHANNHFDTEKNVMATIDTIAGNLNDSIIFFNDQPLDKEQTLEKLNKQSKSAGQKMKVTIFSEAIKLAQTDSGKLKTSKDLAQYTGIINSRVYGSSRNTIAEIESYIRQDIIRSLTTRMQIYYDALLANDDGGNDDTSVQNEEVNSTIPPRRVFYPIHNGNIHFGDYLFQNETEETTVKQSMDILGITLSTKEVNSKVEAVVQLNTSGQEKSENSNISSNEVMSTKDTGRLMLILAIAGAFAALLIAVILHFVLK